MAPNLLTERLRELENDGLIQRLTTEFNVAVYKLTELGVTTGRLLFELARFGSQFPPEEELIRPGNLRAVAVALKMALNAVIDKSDSFRIELRVDDERFDVNVSQGEAQVLYGPSENPAAVLSTSYEPLIEASDGLMPVEEFASKHLEIVDGSPAIAKRFLELLAEGMSKQD